MRESKIYKLAQFAVLRDEYICDHDKLEILIKLIKEEDVALWCEKQKEEKEKENGKSL